MLPPPFSQFLHPTKLFQSAWQTLPTAYNESTAAPYLDFFNTYGTHYTSSAVFGGMGYMTVAVNDAYFSTHSSSEVSAQASAQFDFLCNGGGSGSSSKDQADVSFTNTSSFSATIVGGDPTLGDLTDWKQWLPTFYQAPAMVSYRVRPVSTLITDPIIAGAVNNALQEFAGGFWNSNCTNASETIAGLERRLAGGSSSWRRNTENGGDFLGGTSVASSPAGLMSVQILFVNVQPTRCFIKIYDQAIAPSAELSKLNNSTCLVLYLSRSGWRTS